MTRSLPVLILLVLAALAGCGNKGDLYLPDPASPPSLDADGREDADDRDDDTGG